MSVTPGYTAEDQAAIDHALKCAQSFINEHTHYTERDVLRCAARAALQYRARQAAHPGPVTTSTPLLRPDGRVLCAGSSLGRKRFQQALEFHPVVRHVSWEPFSVLHEWAAAYRARQAIDTLPVSDDLTPRDVIARAISTACGEYEDIPVGFEYWGMTDDVLAALTAAGWSITGQPDEWEYGLRDIATGEAIFDDLATEDDVRSAVKMGAGFTLIRRGIWEVAP